MGLEVDGYLYLGVTTDAIAWGMADTDLGKTAIISNPNSHFSVGLLNAFGVLMCLSNTSITVVKHRQV